MSNDNQIEQEIQAKGLTAPRVTPADIEANIAAEHYFTAYDGAQAIGVFTWRHPVNGKHGTTRPLELLTFCVLVLRNGFTVTGESACASPENFDAELGRKIARRNAEAKIWPLLGYALKERLHRGEVTRIPALVSAGEAAREAMSGVTRELTGIEQVSRAFVGGTLGQALDHLKRGGKVAREGWNGKGMWLALVPGPEWGIGGQAPYDRPGAAHVRHDSFVGMKTADNKFVPWLASQADMLATDWLSVE